MEAGWFGHFDPPLLYVGSVSLKNPGAQVGCRASALATLSVRRRCSWLTCVCAHMQSRMQSYVWFPFTCVLAWWMTFHN
jgi:hypothetical protein